MPGFVLGMGYMGEQDKEEPSALMINLIDQLTEQFQKVITE